LGKRVRKAAKAKKADKVLNEASKRLHTDHDIFEMAKADADRRAREQIARDEAARRASDRHDAPPPDRGPVTTGAGRNPWGR